MDRLDALRAFVAVAERRSFAEAARSLRVSPTAVSRAVAELERDLGVALLRRTTRSVNLTREGELYLERCRTALDELDDAARSLRGQAAEPRGTLIVTAPEMFGRLHILPIVLGLLREHPGLQVELMLLNRVIRLAEEGVDVAVRISELPDSALHAVRVAQVRRMLVASPDYLARCGTPNDPAALRRHSLIVYPGTTPGGEWRFGGAPRVAVRPEPRLLTNSVEAGIDAALDGLGILRPLSYQVDAHVQAGRLVPVLPQFEPPPLPVSLVFQANRRGAAHVRALIDAAQQYFGTQPVR